MLFSSQPTQRVPTSSGGVRMSGGPAELRADGLPIAPLLQYGTPSPEVLECILKDLDQQLLENQRQ